MATTTPIRVLLADDHVLIRQNVRSLLVGYPHIEVIAEASDGDEAVAQAQQLDPAVVVMDIAMPRMDGITATRLIKAHNPQIVVVGLSLHSKEYEVYAMQQAGAFEVLKKDHLEGTLYSAIVRALAAVQPVLIMEEFPNERSGHWRQTEPLRAKHTEDRRDH